MHRGRLALVPFLVGVALFAGAGVARAQTAADLFNPGVLFMGKVMFGLDFSEAKPADIVAKLGDRPIFQVYSKDGDKTVPLDQHYALQAAGATDPNFSTWAAPGSGHVDAFPNNKEEYAKRMVEFYDK